MTHLQVIFIKSNSITNQICGYLSIYVRSISRPILKQKTKNNHSKGSSKHRDDGIKVHFLIFFMGILFLEFCPILEAFLWAMANTVINNTMKAVDEGPTQRCSCLALVHILFTRSALCVSIKAK